MHSAVSEYQTILASGGWPLVPDGPTLDRLAVDSPRIGVLRRRLRITGDLRGEETRRRWQYDERLRKAVETFQYRHGLSIDGVVGPATLAALQVPAERRVEQLRYNLERIALFPSQPGQRHVMVNIPAFRMYAVENEHRVIDSRVIVGMRSRPTPELTSELERIVVNPSWSVPFSIAVKDKLPILRTDPGYLQRNGFEVFSAGKSPQRITDVASIDWNGVSETSFPYHLRQRPGRGNALGSIKFLFPNSHSVYLHDTPSRRLFSRSERAFSSGCIRVAQAETLAMWLLSGATRGTLPALHTQIQSGKQSTLNLDGTVPLYVVYWTAWADSAGAVHFRRDLYDRDPS